MPVMIELPAPADAEPIMTPFCLRPRVIQILAAVAKFIVELLVLILWLPPGATVNTRNLTLAAARGVVYLAVSGLGYSLVLTIQSQGNPEESNWITSTVSDALGVPEMDCQPLARNKRGALDFLFDEETEGQLSTSLALPDLATQPSFDFGYPSSLATGKPEVTTIESETSSLVFGGQTIPSKSTTTSDRSPTTAVPPSTATMAMTTLFEPSTTTILVPTSSGTTPETEMTTTSPPERWTTKSTSTTSASTPVATATPRVAAPDTATSPTKEASTAAPSSTSARPATTPMEVPTKKVGPQILPTDQEKLKNNPSRPGLKALTAEEVPEQTTQVPSTPPNLAFEILQATGFALLVLIMLVLWGLTWLCGVRMGTKHEKKKNKHQLGQTPANLDIEVANPPILKKVKSVGKTNETLTAFVDVDLTSSG